jgi:NAD-dependent SIR2 family protein deacetylase
MTTEPIVTLRHRLTCFHCGAEMEQNQEVSVTRTRYAPPSVPSKCPACNGRLRDEYHSWGRFFEVLEVRTFDD